MPALPVPQQSDWNNNVYVLATTRIFVLIGVAYLFRSLYNLVPSIRGTRSASIAAAVADGIGLEDIVSDDPVGTETDLEANLTLDIHPPQPSYDPQNYAGTTRALAATQNQGMQVSGSPTATNTMPEQHAGVRNGHIDTEEGMDIVADATG